MCFHWFWEMWCQNIGLQWCQPGLLPVAEAEWEKSDPWGYQWYQGCQRHGKVSRDVHVCRGSLPTFQQTWWWTSTIWWKIPIVHRDHESWIFAPSPGAFTGMHTSCSDIRMGPGSAVVFCQTDRFQSSATVAGPSHLLGVQANKMVVYSVSSSLEPAAHTEYPKDAFQSDLFAFVFKDDGYSWKWHEWNWTGSIWTPSFSWLSLFGETFGWHLQDPPNCNTLMGVTGEGMQLRM